MDTGVDSSGVSEEIIGRWYRDRPADVTDRVVLATKGRFAMGQDPNSQGLSTRHLTRALDDLDSSEHNSRGHSQGILYALLLVSLYSLRPEPWELLDKALIRFDPAEVVPFRLCHDAYVDPSRGIDFLVATQKADGSWPMRSRSTPNGEPGSSKLLTPIPCTVPT